MFYRIGGKFQTARLAAGLATALVVGCVPDAVAHDFWLQPSQVETSQTTGKTADVGSGHTAWSVDARIGHSGSSRAWTIAPHRVPELLSWRAAPNGGWDVRDHSDRLDQLAKGQVRLELAKGAQHMISMSTTPTAITLSADAFDAYLREEGLSLALAEREGATSPGRELYSRRAKTLVGMSDSGFAFDQPLGHTLEVVPMTDPTAGGELAFEVRFRGAPLPGATLRLVNLNLGLGDVGREITDAKGRAAFRVPSGRWMLHVAWSEPVEGVETADFSTVFASLSFEASAS